MAVRISKYLAIRQYYNDIITILYSPNLTYFSELYSLNSSLFSERNALEQRENLFNVNL